MLSISAVSNINQQRTMPERRVSHPFQPAFRGFDKDVFQSTIPTITKLSRKEFKQIYPIYLRYRESANATSTIAEVKKYLLEENKRTEDEIFTAAVAGKPVGFLHFGKEFSTLSGNIRYRMKALFVDEEYRGKGIAKRLVEAMQEFAADKEVVVKAKKSNEVSPFLYPKTGFQEDPDFIHFVYRNFDKTK